MEHIGILTIVALVLATYRLTRLVTSDKVPFEKLRIRNVGSTFGYLLTCPFCISVWVGSFVAAGQGLVGDSGIWQVFIGAMALSGVASMSAALAPQLYD